MRCRLENLSDIRRTSWVEVATPPVPGNDKERTFVTTRGLVLRAVRSARRGSHSQFWLIGPVPFSGRQIVEGQITAQEVQPVPFRYSPWLLDEPLKLVPQFKVKIGTQTFGHAGTPQLVDSSPAHHRWRLRSRLNGQAAGFVATIWLTVYHDQDVADLKGSLIWSDRTVPDLDLVVDGTGLEAGEPIYLDFAVRNQHFGPTRESSGKWAWVLTSRQGFTDGGGICVAGRMLGTPAGPLAPDTPQDRLDSLQAAQQAPVKGVCLDWPRNKFLAFGAPWPLEGDSWDRVASSAAARFRGLLASPSPTNIGRPPAPFNAQRPLGSLPAAGGTGDQEDFGATAGGEAIVGGSPAWLWEAEYNLGGNLLRAFTHFEQDATELLFSNHLRWLTWSGWTHNPAQDKLGKRAMVWGDKASMGWTGWDEQHRSWNNWLAYLALADDPLQWSMLQQHMEVDKAMHKNRTDAPRGMGRNLHAWAHSYTLQDATGKAAIKAMMKDKIDILASSWRGGKHSNPVKIMSAGQDPRQGVTDPVSGAVLPNWSVWEHGLLCIGLRAAELVLAGDPLGATCGMIWRKIAATIIDYGFYVQGGQFWVCDNVWYPDQGNANEGQPIDPALYSHTSTVVNAPGIIHAWVIPAVLAYYVQSQASPTRDRAGLILQQWSALDGTASSPRQARWWALEQL